MPPSQGNPQTDQKDRTSRTGSGATLIALLAGQVMANVDTAIVNVAAPSIRHGLHATAGELEFVLSGYLIAYAVLLTSGAKLANKYGYRKVYLVGVGIFTASSLGCGMSPSTVWLITARVIQGIGAALLVAQVLTGIQLSFTDQARRRALNWFSVTLSAASILGQILGGGLVTANLFGLGWRTIFLINVPVGVLILLLGRRVLPPPVHRAETTRVDLAGTAALMAVLSLLIVPLVFGHDIGWPLWTWLALALVGPALVALVLIERTVSRRGRDTVINLAALRHPAIGWGTVTNFVAASTSFGLLFVIALYLQSGYHYTALQSGMVLILWVITFGAGGPILSRLGPTRVHIILNISYFLLALSYLLLAGQLWLFGNSYPAMVAILGLAGLGLGLGFNALVDTLTQAGPDHWATDISALINTSTEVSAALGVAVFGGLYLVRTSAGTATVATSALITVALVLCATAVIAGCAATRVSRNRTGVV